MVDYRWQGALGSYCVASPKAKNYQPFVATASFTNAGQQTRRATCRKNTRTQIQKNQIGC